MNTKRLHVRNAYKIIQDRWFKDRPLKIEEFTLEELNDAISQGCSDRNHSSYMHHIAKRFEKLQKDGKIK